MGGGLLAVGLLAVLWAGRREPPPPTPDPEDPPADGEDWSAALARPRPVFARDVAPVLAKHCLACHSGETAEGGVALDRFGDDGSAAGAGPLWGRVAARLRAGTMPPAGRGRPTPEEADALDAWLDTVLPDDAPGGVTLRRLNRAEYNNTVRDLTGLDLRPADDFPADDTGHGFDNNADVQSLPPVLLERYLAAAERVVDAAYRSETARERLLNPPPDDVVPPAERAFTAPVREDARKRLVLSAADVPAPDPGEEELRRAYDVIRAFADRAFRRPATHEEITRLLRFVEQAQRNGEGPERGLRLALEAVLVSPHFLFRVEPGGRPINQYELATRLSYFLWSSPPDEELFRLAAQGTLRRGNTLAAQVRRMLRDPRSRALAEKFAGQWLQTRGLADLTPDPARFPGFDEPLRSAMVRETELFFDHVVRADRSVLDFLDGDYTFVNERLARHYRLPGVTGDGFRRVALAGTPRGGVLTQAGVLAVTSNPNRTSPVKRGRWVLDNLLGAPPPAPPPGADNLKDGHLGGPAETLRQRLERHRADPACAVCHAGMDPLGLALENFDAVGAWRDQDGGVPIDASGALPGGESFAGPAGLRAALTARRDAFARCLAEKLLTYALGRGLNRSDRRAAAEAARTAARHEYRFSALVLAVVHSEPFQARGGVSPK
jgi:mono/diheme cytochrome c family protein